MRGSISTSNRVRARQRQAFARLGRSGALRFALALLIALAIHALLGALLRAPSRERPAESVSHVELARIQTRPKPTPTPSPPPVARSRRLAPVPARAAAPLRTGAAAHPETIRRVAAARPKPPPISHAKPIWDIATGGQGAGAGDRSGAGSLGSGRGTGLGSGEGGPDSGGGGQPCGFVTFGNAGPPRYDPQTGGYFVTVQMTAHFAGGRAETVLLDYPWYYPSAQANPWSTQNVENDPDAPTPFQFPPANVRATEPDLVRYVIAHTRADGRTTLKDCQARD